MDPSIAQALAAAITRITQSPFDALLVLVTAVALKAAFTLYARNQMLVDNYAKSLIDMTNALNNLAQQIERSNYARKD